MQNPLTSLSPYVINYDPKHMTQNTHTHTQKDGKKIPKSICYIGLWEASGLYNSCSPIPSPAGLPSVPYFVTEQEIAGIEKS